MYNAFASPASSSSMSPCSPGGGGDSEGLGESGAGAGVAVETGLLKEVVGIESGGGKGGREDMVGKRLKTSVVPPSSTCSRNVNSL